MTRAEAEKLVGHIRNMGSYHEQNEALIAALTAPPRIDAEFLFNHMKMSSRRNAVKLEHLKGALRAQGIEVVE